MLTTTNARSRSFTPTNSLGLTLRDLDALLDRIDAEERVVGTKRVHTRRPFRRASLTMHIDQPGGRSTVAVAGRNLSSTGMCVLHRAYLHAGAECTVVLPRVSGGEDTVQGKVLRCVHREGVIHDVAIQFKQRINPNNYDRLEMFSKWLPTLERVDPADVKGSLLVAEDSAAQARLIRHLLRDTGLTITIVGSCQAAIQRAAEGFGAILCDHNLEDGDACRLIDELAAKKIKTPVIIMTAESDPQMLAQIGVLKAAAFIAKPFEASFLIRILAEFLGPDGTDSGGSANGDLSGASLAAVLDDLLGEALKIQTAVTSGDAEAVRRLCMSMRSTAQALSLGPVAHLAEAAVRALGPLAKLDEAAGAVAMLVNACVHASGRRSQAA